MTQPPYGPPPQYAQGGQIPPAPPKKQTGNKTVLVGIIAGVLGLGIGAIGASGNGTTTAGPGATTTVTATANHTIYKTAAGQPTEAPTEQPTDEPAGFKPKKSDFKIGIKILKKQCFGSAGCNVTFRIKPDYVGSQKLPDTGTIEVTYRVSGAEDPIENTFEITGGQASYDKEEDASTTSSSAKLTVKVTDVSYDG
jgi:hypothetical protein